MPLNAVNVALQEDDCALASFDTPPKAAAPATAPTPLRNPRRFISSTCVAVVPNCFSIICANFLFTESMLALLIVPCNTFNFSSSGLISSEPSSTPCSPNL